MKLLKTIIAKRDTKKFMKKFTQQKVETRFRKTIVNILAHKDGPQWRSLAKAQERKLDELQKLLTTIKAQN